MFVYVFTRPDNLVIAPGGDTVNSGFIDLDVALNYLVKSLNQLGQAMNHTAGEGIVFSQDPSSKALTISVKDWKDVAFLSDLAESGQGPECKLLDGVSVNTNGIKNGKYFLKKCPETPDHTKNYFLDTLAYEGNVWQNLYDPGNGERWFRYYSGETNAWASWKPSSNVPTRAIETANLWMEG